MAEPYWKRRLKDRLYKAFAETVECATEQEALEEAVIVAELIAQGWRKRLQQIGKMILHQQPEKP